MIILTEIEDINRFKTLDQLCCYIGLVPMTRSSGEKENAGNITQRKNTTLRTAIIESSWVAIRNDPALMLAYQQLHKRMVPQKAIVRIAKKLTNRIRYVLKNKKTYECTIVK
jgi:transposase